MYPCQSRPVDSSTQEGKIYIYIYQLIVSLISSTSGEIKGTLPFMIDMSSTFNSSHPAVKQRQLPQWCVGETAPYNVTQPSSPV